jgi:hypothetical protein
MLFALTFLSYKYKLKRNKENLYIDLVAAQDNWNVFTDSDQITMPVRDVLISNTRSDIKHNYCAFPINIVTITQTTKFLLAFED